MVLVGIDLLDASVFTLDELGLIRSANGLERLLPPP
jgi:hypothetical protein